MTSHPAPTYDDAAAILAARSAQTEALARGDVDAVAEHWTEDVTIRRALGQAVEGAQAARQVVSPAAQRGDAQALIYQRTATQVEVSAHWPLAWEEGKWTGHLGDVSEPPVIGGRYAAQWVRRDGRWLIRSEVFVALNGRDAGLDAQAVP